MEVWPKAHALCFVVFLLSVFTCGILERRGDTAEDLLREIPQLVSQLETDPLEVGFDRAQYFLLIGTEYQRTIALLLRRRVDSEMEHVIDAHHTHARGISLGHVSVLQQSLRAMLDHLNRLLTVYSSRLIENDNAAYPATTTDIGFFEISSTLLTTCLDVQREMKQRNKTKREPSAKLPSQMFWVDVTKPASFSCLCVLFSGFSIGYSSWIARQTVRNF